MDKLLLAGLGRARQIGTGQAGITAGQRARRKSRGDPGVVDWRHRMASWYCKLDDLVLYTMLSVSW